MNRSPLNDTTPNGEEVSGEGAERYQSALLRLAKIHSPDFEKSLRQILEISGETMQTERVSVWFFDSGYSQMVCRDLYQLRHGSHSRGLTLKATDYPKYFAAMQEQRVIAAGDARRDPRTAEFISSYLEPLGIHAMLDVPIWQRGKMIGVVCHESTAGSLVWTARQQDFATSIADMVSLALETSERVGSEQLRTAIVEAALDCIVTIDGEGRVVEFNPAAVRTFGYSREETIGREMAELIVPPRLRPAHRAGLLRCISTGERRIIGQRVEVEALRADGTEFPAELAITETHQGERVLFTAHLRDISERRAMEAELRALNAELEQRIADRTEALTNANEELRATQEELAAALRAEQELGELRANFVSTVSHEFRTPLGIILSSAEILSAHYSKLDDTEREEHLNTIHAAVKDMSELMEEVLVFHRLGAVGEWESHPIDLPVLCQRVIDEVLSSTTRRCPIACQVGAVPPAVGNEKLIRHILINLLTNAVKYSDSGRPVVLHVEPDGNEAVFRVEDRGIGIPPEDLGTLFQPFRRGSNVGQRAGTGLGLTIAQKCVELLGGKILAQNNSSQTGATFTVHLPLFATSTDSVSV